MNDGYIVIAHAIIWIHAFHHEEYLNFIYFPWIIIQDISVNVHKLFLHGSELYLVAKCESSNIPLCSGHFMEISFWGETKVQPSWTFIAKESLLLILMRCEQGTEWRSKKPLKPDLALGVGVMQWGKPQWGFGHYHIKFHCFLLCRYTALFLLCSTPLRKLKIPLP